MGSEAIDFEGSAGAEGRMTQQTCRQCKHSVGAASDDFTETILMCVIKFLPAVKVCSRFVREPGTMEREDDEAV